MEQITLRNATGEKWFTAAAESVEDLIGRMDVGNAEACIPLVDSDDIVVAWGSAVFESINPHVYNSHRNLSVQMARDIKEGNLWILPTKPRMPFPTAPLYAVASMLVTEQKSGRKCDWFFWTDDDVDLPRDTFRILLEAADPDTAPFVAAVGHDRNFPFLPAVWTKENIQWQNPPESGTHEVGCTGLCAAIIHRSLFDKVPQPWFVAMPGMISTDGMPGKTISPDSWWCQQLNDAGIPIRVSCDTNITHFGERTGVNTKYMKAIHAAVDVKERTPREDGEKPRLILGLGSGRCGTKSLADLLDKQPGVTASHEALRHGEVWRGGDRVRDAILNVIDQFPDSICCDVAFGHINYVGSILRERPDTKFVCLRREKEACVDSIIRKHESMGINTFQEAGPDSVWDATNPTYDASLTHRECAEKYYDEYYAAAEFLQEIESGSFKIFDTNDLNSTDGVNGILDFCEIVERDVAIGIKSNTIKGAGEGPE